MTRTKTEKTHLDPHWFKRQVAFLEALNRRGEFPGSKVKAIIRKPRLKGD